MSDFSLSSRSTMSEPVSYESHDAADAPSSRAEIIVTATMTTIAVVFVSFVAVVMGMA
jgi:hypothetical protein